MKGHIVAMGGGGFLMDGDNTLLDDFILSLAPRQPARICFIPTASAESPYYLVKFYRAFARKALATDLTLFDPSVLPRQPERSSDVETFVSAQDILYVGGGNTANMLAMWRVHSVDRALRKAWEHGAILCGVSAGMLCWFQGGVTDSFGELEAIHDGLGLLEATACPHYDGESERRPTYHRLVAAGMSSGFAADDGAALHFHGSELVEAVSSRPSALAYRVEMVAGQVLETPLATRLLSSLSEIT